MLRCHFICFICLLIYLCCVLAKPVRMDVFWMLVQIALNHYFDDFLRELQNSPNNDPTMLPIMVPQLIQHLFEAAVEQNCGTILGTMLGTIAEQHRS